MFKAREECCDIRFSPDGVYLAAASRDNYIYIFDCENAFRRVACLRGHSSYITHIDWSADSRFLQSNDGAYEILYWDVDEGQQQTKTLQMRDTQWQSWTCVLGWPVQGIWSPYSDGTDINALCRSQSELYCVAGDDSFQVNFYTWPALKGAYGQCKKYAGHCSHVLGVRFSATDSHVISVGGNDCSIFQWAHVEAGSGDLVRYVTPQVEEVLRTENAGEAVDEGTAEPSAAPSTISTTQ